jgi:hypothetical protein
VRKERDVLQATELRPQRLELEQDRVGLKEPLAKLSAKEEQTSLWKFPKKKRKASGTSFKQFLKAVKGTDGGKQMAAFFPFMSKSFFTTGLACKRRLESHPNIIYCTFILVILSDWHIAEFRANECKRGVKTNKKKYLDGLLEELLLQGGVLIVHALEYLLCD